LLGIQTEPALPGRRAAALQPLAQGLALRFPAPVPHRPARTGPG
jgi:hypothetical protein